MGGFVQAVLSFPTVVFTPLLVVVIGYWIVVVAGGADPDSEADGGDAGSGPLAFLGPTGPRVQPAEAGRVARTAVGGAGAAVG